MNDEVTLGDLLLDLEAKIWDRAPIERGDLLQPLGARRDGVVRIVVRRAWHDVLVEGLEIPLVPNLFQ